MQSSDLMAPQIILLKNEVMALLHIKSSTYILLHSYCNISEMGLHSVDLKNLLVRNSFLRYHVKGN